MAYVYSAITYNLGSGVDQMNNLQFSFSLFSSVNTVNSKFMLVQNCHLLDLEMGSLNLELPAMPTVPKTKPLTN